MLDLLTKKKKQVAVIILTKNISKAVALDMKKFNEQYGNLTIKQFKKAHDRFLIFDRKIVYHFGASLKDAGKKWFAFTKMDLDSFSLLENMIRRLRMPKGIMYILECADGSYYTGGFENLSPRLSNSERSGECIEATFNTKHLMLQNQPQN